MEPKAILYLSAVPEFSLPEKLYLDVRRKEGRIWTDDAVKNLPMVSASSPYAMEWRWRARSLARFQKHLPANKNLRILDLGCGNGWMANRLAQNPNYDVWAVDVNREELEQGARLFGRENLRFVYADLNTETRLADLKPFDCILLAASVQYFPDLTALLNTLRQGLNPEGEIHILDSPFYPDAAARNAARERSSHYYLEAGVPDMANFYHHHLWPEAKGLGAKNLNAGWNIRLLQRLKWLAPFPWLCFRKSI